MIATAFILCDGTVQTSASLSISSHVASRASPLRHAVNTTKRKHNFADFDALDSSIAPNAAGTSWYGSER